MGEMDDGPIPSRAEVLNGLPIEIRVCVGHARPKLGEMLALAPDGVLPLDSRIEDEVQLYVGDRMIATGELVELDEAPPGRLAVRITGLGGRAEDAG